MEFGLQNYDPRGRLVTNKTELGDIVAKAFEPIEPVAGRSDFYHASVYAVALHRILSAEDFDEIIEEASFEVIQHPDNGPEHIGVRVKLYNPAEGFEEGIILDQRGLNKVAPWVMLFSIGFSPSGDDVYFQNFAEEGELNAELEQSGSLVPAAEHVNAVLEQIRPQIQAAKPLFPVQDQPAPGM
jgi:hypothetical protein